MNTWCELVYLFWWHRTICVRSKMPFFSSFFSFSRCPSQKIFFSLLLCACGGLPRTHKLRFPLLRLQSRQRFHNYVKPEVTLKIDLALHASPAARNFTFQISSLPVHSAWFFPRPSSILKWRVSRTMTRAFVLIWWIVFHIDRTFALDRALKK